MAGINIDCKVILEEGVEEYLMSQLQKGYVDNTSSRDEIWQEIWSTIESKSDLANKKVVYRFKNNG